MHVIRAAIAALVLGLALVAAVPAATPCPTGEPCDPPITTAAPKAAPDPASTPAVAAPTAPVLNVRGTLAGNPIAACPSGEACDPPQAGAFVLFSRLAKPTVRARVSGGAFAVHLAAGLYTIKLAPSPASGHVTPARVRVPSTSVVHLKLVVQPKL